MRGQDRSRRRAEDFPTGGPAVGRSVADFDRLRRRLEATGLLLRGGFHPRSEDRVPALPDGRPAGTLLLVGNAGNALWRHLRRSPEARTAHPFDAYCRRILGTLAGKLGGHAVFPGDGPPWLPFQRWAMRAEPGLRPSPSGILVHPVFGPWHAYRGALLFSVRLPLAPPEPVAHPCEHCHARPCLSACPAGAVSAAGYDVERCRKHLVADPEGPCMHRGCLARHGCPIGCRYTYDPAQAAHHMRAFVTSKAGRVSPGNAPARRDSVRRRRCCRPSPARRD